MLRKPIKCNRLQYKGVYIFDVPLTNLYLFRLIEHAEPLQINKIGLFLQRIEGVTKRIITSLNARI